MKEKGYRNFGSLYVRRPHVMRTKCGVKWYELSVHITMQRKKISAPH